MVLYAGELILLWVIQPGPDNPWWQSEAPAVLVGAALVFSIGYFLYAYSGSLILRLSGARPLAKDDGATLRKLVADLCIGAGLPEPALYAVESDSPNAFAAGLSPEHAVLVVTRGLLRLFDRDDLEAIVALELAHIANYDTRLKTILAAGITLLRLPAALVVGFYRGLFRLWRLNPLVGFFVFFWFGGAAFWLVPLSLVAAPTKPHQDTVLVLVGLFYYLVLPYAALLAPVVTQFVAAAASRQRELKADADAVLLIRNPVGLARALAKMSAATSIDLAVPGALSQLYAVDPLGSEAGWLDRVFSPHPRLEERLSLLGSMGSGLPPSVFEQADAAGAAFRLQTDIERSRSVATSPEAALAPAPVAVAGPPVAFRLTAGAPLYKSADLASEVIEQLPAGALVTVHQEAGEFTRVFAPDDKAGYLDRKTPMTAV